MEATPGKSKTKATVVDGQPVIIMERMIEAKPEAVWRAWEDPEAFAQWMGPLQTAVTMQSSDFRVGGMRRYIMHVPDMGDFPNRTTYREIEARDGVVAFGAVEYGKSSWDKLAAFAEAHP
jgi:uncharacterized protein YndB with AHSA1/START domain